MFRSKTIFVGLVLAALSGPAFATYCPSGQQWDYNKKKCVTIPPPTCPAGQTGTPPNCTTPPPPTCPTGQTGTPPNCTTPPPPTTPPNQNQGQGQEQSQQQNNANNQNSQWWNDIRNTSTSASNATAGALSGAHSSSTGGNSTANGGDATAHGGAGGSLTNSGNNVGGAGGSSTLTNSGNNVGGAGGQGGNGGAGGQGGRSDATSTSTGITGGEFGGAGGAGGAATANNSGGNSTNTLGQSQTNSGGNSATDVRNDNALTNTGGNSANDIRNSVTSNTGGNTLTNGSNTANNAASADGSGNANVSIDSSNRSVTNYDGRSVFHAQLPTAAPAIIAGPELTTIPGQCGPRMEIVQERIEGRTGKRLVDLGYDERLVPAKERWIYDQDPYGNRYKVGHLANETVAVINVASSKSFGIQGGNSSLAFGGLGMSGGGAAQRMVKRYTLVECELLMTPVAPLQVFTPRVPGNDCSANPKHPDCG